MYIITLLIAITSLTLNVIQLNQKSDLDMVYSMNIEDNGFMD